MSKEQSQYKQTIVNSKGETKTIIRYTDTGRFEKEVLEDIKTINSYSYRRNYDPIKIDELRREFKIGKYREWEFDIERIKIIQDKVGTGEAHMHPDMALKHNKIGLRGRKTKGSGLGSGKKQREAEEIKLIAEIENM
jgi:hypothetical protein